MKIFVLIFILQGEKFASKLGTKFYETLFAYFTIFGCPSSFNNAISLIAVLGTPSVSLKENILLSKNVYQNNLFVIVGLKREGPVEA